MPRLPSDETLWFDDLRQEYVPPDRVAAALASYDRLNFSNIAGYLSYYLKNDVVSLRKACLIYFKELDSTLSINPLESGKFTASSLTFYAVMMSLYRRKLPTGYSMDWRPAYGMLKHG